MLDTVERAFERIVPDTASGFFSLRLVEERNERLWMRQGVLQPYTAGTDVGAMITAVEGGGLGYAATGDLSEAGLARALERARTWARRTARANVFGSVAGALGFRL